MLADGRVKIMVAVADVDALVPKGSAIDRHARINTTSVYTGARIFPMLPERLSTDLTSLNQDEDRLAIVTTMVFNPDASLAGSTVFQALVRNKAQLAYDAVSDWLEGQATCPPLPRPCRAWTRSCAPRTASRSSCARAAASRARWSSRPSSRARCSTASRWSTSASSRTTGRAS